MGGNIQTVTYDLIWDDKLEHLGKSVAFLQGEFGDPDSEPVWTTQSMQWKLCETNPAGRGLMHVALMDDTVIGTVTVIKKRLLVDGREITGAEIGDTYSSAEYRRIAVCRTNNAFESDPAHYKNKSIFGRCVSEITQRAVSQDVALVYGTPNQNSMPGYVNRLGFKEASAFVVRSASRLSLSAVLKRGGLPGFVVRPLSGVLFAIRKLMKPLYLLPHSVRGVVVKQGMPDPAVIDDLWGRVKPERGFALVRDGAYWNHRYLQNPIGDFQTFAFCRSSTLVGMLVVRLRREASGSTVVQVAEWMGDADFSLAAGLNVVLNAFDDLQISKFNLWVSQKSPDYWHVLLNGFIPRARVPVILYGNEDYQDAPVALHPRGFFVGSSDNV